MHFWAAITAGLAGRAAGTPTPDIQQQQHRQIWPYQATNHAKEHLPPIASRGCGKPPPILLEDLSPINLTIHSAGLSLERKYGLWLPPGYDANKPSPVIFAFHEDGANPLVQESVSELFRPDPDAADSSSNYVLVYPESTEQFAGRMWQASPAIALKGVDDMAFVRAVLDNVKDELCVDESRVYATGFGQGGGMTNMLACDPDLSKQFAAFAPVAGAYLYAWPDLPMGLNWDQLNDGSNSFLADTTNATHCRPRDDPVSCSPGRPGIPIMAFHGGGDTEIVYTGGEQPKHLACTPSLNHWIANWARRNGLDPEDIRTSDRTSDRLPAPISTIGGAGGNRNKKLGSDSVRYVYGEHTDPRGIVTLVWHGGEHEWPKTYEYNERPVTATFNATPMIMEFFGRFSLHDTNPNQDYIIKQPGDYRHS
ncbi:polyhydroxybutyrate depolymerase [Microdochium nivale]|nr:polyhydroxybutyrate depolymerase [Microdochium nivale]